MPDDVFEQASKQFTEKELVDLTLAVTTINTFNRLNMLSARRVAITGWDSLPLIKKVLYLMAVRCVRPLNTRIAEQP